MTEQPEQDPNVKRGTHVTGSEQSDADVNQPESEAKGKKPGRDEKGRITDGTLGAPYRWGPDNPPPRSPGRPPDIWGRVRRKLLELDKKTKAEKAEIVADKIVEKLVEGDQWQWIKETLDREHGKPKESLQVEGIVPRTLKLSRTDADELLERMDEQGKD